MSRASSEKSAGGFAAPPEGSIPLALAPFVALEYSLSSDGSVVLDVDQHASLEARFVHLTGAASAIIDRERGVFELLYRRSTPELNDTFPWCRPTFAPFEDLERVFGFGRLSAQQKEDLKIATGKIWASMNANLASLVQSGFFRIAGRLRSPLSFEYIEVPMSVFQFFLVEDWEAGISLCQKTNERIFDVVLTRSEAAVSKSVGSAKNKRDCVNRLVSLRKSGPPEKTKEAYKMEAMESFHLGPHQFLDCWNKAADEHPNEHWSKPGRRPRLGFQSIGQ